MGGEHTIDLLALGPGSLSHLAGLLEVDVPTLGLSLGVLQGEGEDGVALLDGILAFAVVG